MAQNRVAIATLIGTILLSLAACDGTGPTAGDPLDGTSWELMAYGKTRPIIGTTISATFEDGEVSGSAGCNTYFGSYQVRGDTLMVNEIAITEMACLEPAGAMEQELVYVEFLSDAQSFRSSDGQLQIFRSDGEALTFAPRE